LNRVVKLDPDNSDAWDRRCTFATEKDDPAIDIATCRRAVQLNQDAWNYDSLGLAQERAGDFCAAEGSFTSAVQKENGKDAGPLRNMGRAAIRCGRTGGGIAGFEMAEAIDAKAVADPEDDGDTKDDLKLDREYLVVVYDRLGEPEKSHAMCAKAHPEWAGCACELDQHGVKCSERAAAPTK